MNILISPSSFGECGDAPLLYLKENNFNLIENPYKRKLTELEVIDLAKECIGIIAGLEPLNERVIENLPKLKCISRVGVGMDNVDIEFAKKKSGFW